MIAEKAAAAYTEKHTTDAYHTHTTKGTFIKYYFAMHNSFGKMIWKTISRSKGISFDKLMS